jgi:hypothetical protein
MEKKKKKTWRIERVVGGFLEEREREGVEESERVAR